MLSVLPFACLLRFFFEKAVCFTLVEQAGADGLADGHHIGESGKLEGDFSDAGQKEHQLGIDVHGTCAFHREHLDAGVGDGCEILFEAGHALHIDADHTPVGEDHHIPDSAVFVQKLFLGREKWTHHFFGREAVGMSKLEDGAVIEIDHVLSSL